MQFLPLLGFILLLPKNTFSAEDLSSLRVQASECRELTNYGHIAGCFSKIHMKSDGMLNQTYKELFNYLKESDRKNLVDAQRKWIEFRDADCKFSDPRDKKDNIPRANEAVCLMEHTLTRLEKLREYNADYNKGCNGCPW